MKTSTEKAFRTILEWIRSSQTFDQLECATKTIHAIFYNIYNGTTEDSKKLEEEAKMKRKDIEKRMALIEPDENSYH